MSESKRPAAQPGTPADAPARPKPAYEAPSLVEVGTLRDLTAGGSFNDPT